MATRHKGPDSKGTKPGFPLKSGLLMADLTQRREAAKTQSFSFLPLQSTRIAHLWQNSSFSVFSCSKGLHLRQSASICGQFRIRLRLAALQCYFRELCIFDKVFPSLFSQFAPVQILWLRLAAPGLCLFASLRWIPYAVDSLSVSIGVNPWFNSLLVPGRFGILSLFAENQLKCLSLNHLRASRSFPGQA